jgi:hypothetical protein
MNHSRMTIARVTVVLGPSEAVVAGGGAAVAGGATSALLGGGIMMFGIYLLMFGSPVTQPLGLVLGFGGMLVGVALERGGY